MKVTQIGRLQWYVSSETRTQMVHLVDFEADLDEPGAPPMRCSCEAWNLLVMRPCKHVLGCIDYLVDNMRLTVKERDSLRARLEELARIGQRPERQVDPLPEKMITSFKTKRRDYVMKI